MDQEKIIKGRMKATAYELQCREVITQAMATEHFKSQGENALASGRAWYEALWALDELRGSKRDHVGYADTILTWMSVACAGTYIALGADGRLLAMFMGWLMAAGHFAWCMRLWCKHNAAAYGRVAEATTALQPFLPLEVQHVAS